MFRILLNEHKTNKKIDSERICGIMGTLKYEFKNIPEFSKKIKSALKYSSIRRCNLCPLCLVHVQCYTICNSILVWHPSLHVLARSLFSVNVLPENLSGYSFHGSTFFLYFFLHSFLLPSLIFYQKEWCYGSEILYASMTDRSDR